MKQQGRRRRAISDATSSNNSDDNSSDVEEGNSSVDEENEIITKIEKDQDLNLLVDKLPLDVSIGVNITSNTSSSISIEVEKNETGHGASGVNIVTTESNNIKGVETKNKLTDKKRDNLTKSGGRSKQRSPRKDPSFVPTSGQFFLHDDREGEVDKVVKRTSKSSPLQPSEEDISKTRSEFIKPTRLCTNYS